MCRQRVAATKIDSPLMVVSGGHVRLERVRATQRSSTNFCYFSRLAHTNWRRGDDAYRWGEIDQLEGSGTRSAGHGTGRMLHNERE